MIFLLHAEWPEMPPYKLLLTYYVWRMFEWHIPSCEGHFRHQAWSWTTVRRGNVFYYVYNAFYFCHVFTFFNVFYFYLNVFYIYEFNWMQRRAQRLARPAMPLVACVQRVICTSYAIYQMSPERNSVDNANKNWSPRQRPFRHWKTNFRSIVYTAVLFHQPCIVFGEDRSNTCWDNWSERNR